MAVSNPDTLFGCVVHDVDGTELGQVDDVYFDSETDKPEWAAIKSGPVGGHVSLLPLVNVTQDRTGLLAPYTRDQIEDAPHHDPGDELSVNNEAELFRYYGIAHIGETVTAQPGTVQGAPARPDADRSAHPAGAAPAAVAGDGAMIRSEEQIHVGTRRLEVGRARLRRYVVIEKVTQEVAVSHEEIRVERHEITGPDRDAAEADAEISEAVYEVVLHAETPVVDKEVVAVERVRLTPETVTGEESVSAEVRQEQIVEETVPAERKA